MATKPDIAFGIKYFLFIAIVIILPLVLYIRDCSKPDPYKNSDWKAYRDSVDRVEREQQERWLKEREEHLAQFFTAYDKYYDTFESVEELDEWLLRANTAAFELLHRLYGSKYDDYNGPEGIDKMAQYLFWGPPEYETTCERCGETVYFSEDE